MARGRKRAAAGAPPKRTAEPAPGTAEPAAAQPPWWKQYRILLLVYVVGMTVGAREYLMARGREDFGWLTPEGRELIAVLAQINPDDPDTDFLEGMEALSAGDEREFFRRVDRALSANPRHNELFLRLYAQYLLDVAADPDELNAAVNRWRENFPYSRESVALPVPGPVADPEAVEGALRRIPWVADARLAPAGSGPDRRVVAHLLFRRGVPVDVRDALAALRGPPVS